MAAVFPVRCCGSAGEAFAAVLILSNAILFGVQAREMQVCRQVTSVLIP